MSSTFVKDPAERLRNLFSLGQIEVNKNVPIRRYYRSCQEINRMAGVYYSEKNLENAYVLYAKFIILSFEKLKTHPEFSKVPPAEKAANKKTLKLAFERAENIKKILKARYEQEYENAKKETERLLELARIEEEKKKQELERIKEEEENMLKLREKQQMDAFVEEQRRKELEKERLAIEAAFASKLSVQDNKQPLIPVDFAPPPDVLSSSQLEPHRQKPVTGTSSTPSFDRSLKPAPIESTASYKDTSWVNETSGGATDASSAFAASLIRSKNKYGLRTVLSPSNIPSDFMVHAKTNTAKNIETCGVLFGKLANEVFIITHVLLPHQSGAPDSCDTTREEDMWEFQDQYDGICLGWIHTHPTQTAFLSSVDLHTHYPYQCLMPESVAIVCSGKYNEVGYFMLTPHHGMNVIGSCQKPGFHPHSKNPPLFEACDHVKNVPTHTAQFVDWRNK